MEPLVPVSLVVFMVRPLMSHNPGKKIIVGFSLDLIVGVGVAWDCGLAAPQSALWETLLVAAKRSLRR